MCHHKTDILLKHLGEKMCLYLMHHILKLQQDAQSLFCRAAVKLVQQTSHDLDRTLNRLI